MSRMHEKREEAPAAPSVRIDKWLWAARFFKTRAIASDAVAGGKVEVNGERVKPARALKAGELVQLRLGPYLHVVRVLALADKRGPASVAATLYAETPESKEAREKHAWQLRHAAPVIDPGEGRPTKRDRRTLEKWRGR